MALNEQVALKIVELRPQVFIYGTLESPKLNVGGRVTGYRVVGEGQFRNCILEFQTEPIPKPNGPERQIIPANQCWWDFLLLKLWFSQPNEVLGFI